MKKSISTQTSLHHVSPSTDNQKLVEVAPFLLLKEIRFMKQLIYVPTPALLDAHLGAVLLWKPLIFVRYITFPLQETYEIYKELLSPFQCILVFAASY